MQEEYAIRRYEQAAALLPMRWQRLARQLPDWQKARAEELRLRAGRAMTVLVPEGEVPVSGETPQAVVTQTDLEQLCDSVTGYSRYAAADTLSRGYLTARGGFRIGVCGTAVLRGGVNTNLRDISSVTVRISREQPGIADGLVPQLCPAGRFESTLILAPPGLGKTTLLRDLIRRALRRDGGTPGAPRIRRGRARRDRGAVSGHPADGRWRAHGRARRMSEGASASRSCCVRRTRRSSPSTRSPCARICRRWPPPQGCGVALPCDDPRG